MCQIGKWFEYWIDTELSVWNFKSARRELKECKEQERFLEFAKKEGISEMVEPVLLSLEVDDE